jgi:hypothetical protein
MARRARSNARGKHKRRREAQVQRILPPTLDARPEATGDTALALQLFAEATLVVPGGVRAPLRLVSFERQAYNQSEWNVINIKEMEVFLPTADPRFLLAWEGLARVLPDVESWVHPSDLTEAVESALKLKTPQTAEDYEVALRAKSRLGKYLA